jgi:GPH family glycoside/pentoside/hexuronide:cation symporter
LLLGDIIEENELATGFRQEGLYYSARAFFAKASYSFGYFVAGLSLGMFLHLPFDAVLGQLGEGISLSMGIIAGPVMGVAAVLIYSRYNLTRLRHRQVLALLEDRSAAAK